ncbi:hypothetical protein [Nocardioides sp. Root140]|uniref:hypothetical protein n=1 Tax=Nocardioides sp. Root140 TaxID=1736460 RepID=UPI0006FAE171|nr:hypothetical protein [Nocardioides sp. Root140]KQY56635.1 hypothetical protein ASD30_09950 [Nocardioides sp. Root140]
MPPDHSDESCTDLGILRVSRQEWYAAAGEELRFDQVPNPAYAVPGQEGGPERPGNDRPAFGCLIVVVAMLVATSLATNYWRHGQTSLGWIMLGLALLVGLGVAKLLAFMGGRFIDVAMARRVARPWTDFAAAADSADRDHFDLSWSVFAAHEAEMRAAVTALGEDQLSDVERARLQSRADELGAEAFALRAHAERVSRALDSQTGDTGVRRGLIDTLPAFDADELASAASATETVVSAGLAPLRGREDDIDFASLVQLRRRHYAAPGADLELPNPRRPFVDVKKARTRRRVHGVRSGAATGLALLALVSFCILLVTAFTGPVLACVLAGVAAILAVGMFGVITPEDPHLHMVVMPAELAMPWADVMAAAQFVASGRAAVGSVHAIGAAEPRARAALSILFEDHQARRIAESRSAERSPAVLGVLADQDRTEVREDSHDLCARIWALHRIEILADEQLQDAAEVGDL